MVIMLRLTLPIALVINLSNFGSYFLLLMGLLNGWWSDNGLLNFGITVRLLMFGFLNFGSLLFMLLSYFDLFMFLFNFHTILLG